MRLFLHAVRDVSMCIKGASRLVSATPFLIIKRSGGGGGGKRLCPALHAPRRAEEAGTGAEAAPVPAARADAHTPRQCRPARHCRANRAGGAAGGAPAKHHQQSALQARWGGEGESGGACAPRTTEHRSGGARLLRGTAGARELRGANSAPPPPPPDRAPLCTPQGFSTC